MLHGALNPCWLGAFAFLLPPISAISKTKDPGLFHFVTRPDIKAPRWKVNIHHEDRISSGYWFVAPREPLGQIETVGPWVGPAIYDGRGELVWSGAPLFRNTMVDDFRISNVAGEDVMTLLHNEKGQGITMKPSYTVSNAVRLGDPRTINIHEYHFVDSGTRALVIRSNKTQAAAEDVQSVHGIDSCEAEFDGFEEFETGTWKSVFKWSSFGRIGLNESTVVEDSTAGAHQCSQGGWDFLHVNSVDKSSYGDYLLCARFTDAIYKISPKDGAILWRLGGTLSDFDMGGVQFSGQHSARYVGENHTHSIISILDNAIKDELQPTHDRSRGLLLALHTAASPMTVTVLAEYEHPYGSGAYAHARGNYQGLANGNVFMGWSKQATHSEHSPDGTLVMDAHLVPEWLGSYRNYKFDFVGEPREEIAVVAEADASTTTIHVSWNGATEVDAWRCYERRRRPHGDGEKTLLASAVKHGFETKIVVPQRVTSVSVEAVGRDGKVLGTSAVVYTSSEAEHAATDPSTFQSAPASPIPGAQPLLGSRPVLALLAINMAFMFLVCLWRFFRNGRIRHSRRMGYQRLREAEGNAVVATGIREKGHRQRHHSSVSSIEK